MIELALLLVVTVPAGLVALAVGRVRRLHRLHVRVDAARSGLESALHHRAAVAAEITRAGPREECVGDPTGSGLGVAAAAALRARGVDRVREDVENVLGRRLAALDRAALPAALRAELAEAELLVVLGRSVYHDAVRDTLDLRSRRMVRWLRLAGTAPLPAYLDIAVTPDSTRNAVAPADVTSDHPVPSPDLAL